MPDETTPNPAETSETQPPVAEAASPDAQPAEGGDGKPARAAKAKPAEGEDGKPARPPKKEKAPALEDKPFAEFITQDVLPNLQTTLAKVGVNNLDLKFEKRRLPIANLGDDQLWQIIGNWQNGERQFFIIFSKEDIQAPKFFCYADNGQPSTLESFMIDERKVSLDLLLLYAVQRLNGQKWLVRN